MHRHHAAFAVLTQADFVPRFTHNNVPVGLPTVVTSAHAVGTKVLLAIGGWSGTIQFSNMASSSENRAKFITWNVEFIKKYDTDGVDIDWEYPGRQGAACNIVDAANDANNFLLLLKELRVALDANFSGTHKEVTIATRVQPFDGPNGPLTDVSAFVPYVDRFNLMTYDINGAFSSPTGPNAPFNFQQGKGAPFSYVKAIDDWMAAGVAASKIVAGLAFYGRSSQALGVTGDQYMASQVGHPPIGDEHDAFWKDPSCSLDPAGFSGIWKWRNLRSQDVLVTPTTAGAGWTRNWDPISQTPWLFNPSTKVFISYDDPVSLKVKIDYALCKGIAGVMAWEISNDNGELLDVARNIQGPTPQTCDVPSATTSTAVTSVEQTSTSDAVASSSTDVGVCTSPVYSTSSVAQTTSPSPTTSSDGCSDGAKRCASPNVSSKFETCNYGSWTVVREPRAS
ncbi:glycosyl hydrolases family 18-domain-containing protein [Jimgerdemannia flammicorona]|uniref:Glycosyl hydrolases family 18-domain-containing protein n=1 Tax=Jimgerdemannia flammicorona TaxID=994334 RepID=A0A433DDM2_9FUNG|nr:glycosyl hydrolases family 18-domain-containing protein [Jimgerdemannia flammicorona]